MPSFDYLKKTSDVGSFANASMTDENGVVVDLTNETEIALIVRQLGQSTGTVYTDGELDGVGSLGKVKKKWLTGEMDTPGAYEAEWRITFTGGKKIYFPSKGYLIFLVTDNLE